MTDQVKWDECDKGYVYFIAEALPYHGRMDIPGQYRTETGQFRVEYIKIGWTTKEPKERLAGLQTANPRELFVLGSIFTNREAERMIHKTLVDGWVRGEWFHFKTIGERLAMWMPIFDYYDFDRNVLNLSRYELKVRAKQEKTYFEIPDSFNEIIQFFPNYMHNESFTSGLLKPTTANKMHFDIINNIINEGDLYYKIEDGAGWDQVTKISKSTLSMFFKLIEKFNLKEVMKILSDRNKSYLSIKSPKDSFLYEQFGHIFKDDPFFKEIQ